MSQKIYTRDQAMLIVEMFEELLVEYNIRIPSPEDDDRAPEDLGLYGSTYSILLDYVENKIIEILYSVSHNTEVIQDKFSGSV